MEELNLLRKLERVKAPPDFEEKLFAQLPIRKERRLRVRTLRLSLAGAFSVLFAAAIIVNVFFIREKGALKVAEMEKEAPASALILQKEESLSPRPTIPIIEVVDFDREIQSASRQPQTIYILEQVLETKRDKIKF